MTQEETPTATHLGYSIVYVEHVPETLAFWQAAFGLELGFLHDGEDYGELATGTTKLAFTAHRLAATAVPIPYEPVTADGPCQGFELTLVTPDPDAVYRSAVAAGARSVAEPHDAPWGQRVSYVRDPNGILVGIASPMG